MRRERKISILLALAMIMQLLLPVYGRDVFAIENGKIVSNLRILPIKKDEYKPGESLAVAGDWKLPNDTEDKTWVAGDQFEIGIPDGITAKPINIQFKDNKTGKILGEGVYNESSRKYIFTFTEEIEGLQGREGGFIMQFTIDENETENDEIPLDFEHEGKVELGPIKVVEGNSGVIVGPGGGERVIEGMVMKNSYPQVDYSTGEVRWYMRVNYNGDHVGEIKVEDIVGDHHFMIKDSIVIKERYTNGYDVRPAITAPDGSDGVVVTDLVGLEVNDKGFKFTGETYKVGVDGEGKDIVSYYDISYSTQYDGTKPEKQEVKEGEPDIPTGVIRLRNSVEGTTPSDKEVSEGYNDFIDNGWGSGLTDYQKFSIKKIDADTKEPLGGVKFKLTHMLYKYVDEIETNEEGIGSIEQLIEGPYEIEEITTLEGYKILEEPIKVLHDGKKPMVVEIENEKIGNEDTEVAIKKNWEGTEGEELPDIRVELIVESHDGEELSEEILELAKRPGANLRDGKSSFTFRQLPKYERDDKGFDDKSKPIKYSVRELIDGMEVTSEKNETGYISEIVEEDTKAGKEIIITNTKEEKLELTEVRVIKEWMDQDDEDRPKEVKIKLFADGREIKDGEVLLNNENGWKHTFDKLPKHEINEEGNLVAINYTVKEYIYNVEVTSEKNETGYTLLVDEDKNELGKEIRAMNTKDKPVIPAEPELKGSLKIVKVDGEDKKALSGAEFKLLKGKEVVREGLRTDASGEILVEDLELGVYTLVETKAPEGYVLKDGEIEVEIGEKELELEITVENTKDEPVIPDEPEPIKTVDFKINKVWQDKDGNALSEEFKKEVTLKLLANGKETGKLLILNKDNGWSDKFEDLKLEDDNGNIIEYTVKEEIVAGFELVNTKLVGENEITITNKELPTDPEDPKPVEPTDPEPVEPIDPEDPKPIEPEDPEPVDPGKPIIPEFPIVPEKPTVPEEPTVPEKPVVEEPKEPEVPKDVPEPEEPEEDDETFVKGEETSKEEVVETPKESNVDKPGIEDREDNQVKLPKTGANTNYLIVLFGTILLIFGIRLSKKQESN